jgi:hypothetical protein
MARPTSPQDKKANELAHDRRNTYGENDKSSRRAIRLRKRWRSRLERQALRQALDRSAATAEDSGIDVPAPRGQWRKSPDTSVGELLRHRRYNRVERALRARTRDDPEFLDRLEPALVRRGVDELAARMIVRTLRAELLTHQRDVPKLPPDILALLLELIRKLP